MKYMFWGVLAILIVSILQGIVTEQPGINTGTSSATTEEVVETPKPVNLAVKAAEIAYNRCNSEGGSGSGSYCNCIKESVYGLMKNHPPKTQSRIISNDEKYGDTGNYANAKGFCFMNR